MAGKSLDHLVLLVHQLEESASRYRRIGFNVRPIARHIEFGSSNCVIHFPNSYLELLCLTEADMDMAAPYMDRFNCGEGIAPRQFDE